MQTKLMSAIEATANVLIGYLIALAAQLIIFPLFNINVPLSDNLMIGGLFTVVSLIRSYVLRRLFNRLHKR